MAPGTSFVTTPSCRVLSDYETFSSQFGQGGGEDAGQPFAASMISTDPPRHRQLRALVTQAFTPRAVEALAPRIAAIVDELLDQVMAQGKMDVIEDFGYPLPVIVIAEMLGVPPEDRAQFKPGPTPSSRLRPVARWLPTTSPPAARWPATSCS